MSEMDYDCGRFKDRVMDESVWREQHTPHLGEQQEFTEQDLGHPSGAIVWLCCPCGKKIAITKEKA